MISDHPSFYSSFYSLNSRAELHQLYSTRTLYCHNLGIWSCRYFVHTRRSNFKYAYWNITRDWNTIIKQAIPQLKWLDRTCCERIDLKLALFLWIENLWLIFWITSLRFLRSDVFKLLDKTRLRESSRQVPQQLDTHTQILYKKIQFSFPRQKHISKLNISNISTV